MRLKKMSKALDHKTRVFIYLFIFTKLDDKIEYANKLRKT